VKLPLTPFRAIEAATVHAADWLGCSDKVSALEPGKWADLIAVEHDPLPDLTRLERLKFLRKGGGGGER
jgi:imidazolonepropionase-like amidohydrolase